MQASNTDTHAALEKFPRGMAKTQHLVNLPSVTTSKIPATLVMPVYELKMNLHVQFAEMETEKRFAKHDNLYQVCRNTENGDGENPTVVSVST